jgi:hypothetical protein
MEFACANAISVSAGPKSQTPCETPIVSGFIAFSAVMLL